MIVAKVCPNCRLTHKLEVDEDKYWSWTKREANIQDMFPELTSTQREFLITGICSDECWQMYLGPEPE